MINKIKTPKLKSEDRIKLIDRPDLLMVIPLTHAASVRYGANTEWCTAVPSSDVSFNDYTNEGFLVYIIYYNVVNKKRSEERYKIALYINVDVDDEEFEMSGFAKDDTELDVNFIEDFLLDKEMQDKIDYYYIEYKNSKLLDFKINSEIDCSEIKNRIFTIKSITHMTANHTP